MATAKQLIVDYLTARPQENAFLRSEFDALGKSRSSMDKALRQLIKEGILVRGGWGVLVRGQYTACSRKPSPVCDPHTFGFEALRKLGVEPEHDPHGHEPIAPAPTQVDEPVRDPGRTLVGRSRISRRIGFNDVWLRYTRGDG